MSVSIAIHESKNSEKVIKFINAEQPKGLFHQLLDYTNAFYAKQIVDAMENNTLYGAYLTKSGNLKATFI